MNKTLSPFQIDRIARVAHEANRAYCELLGDFSHYPWESAPEWQRTSARAGVVDVATNERSPEQSHESWMARKLAEGWQYGPEKDLEKKTHPCLVSYKDLPFEQQYKDTLFTSTVKAMLDGLWRIPQ